MRVGWGVGSGKVAESVEVELRDRVTVILGLNDTSSPTLSPLTWPK